MLIFQIIVSLVILGFISKLFIRYKNKEISFKKLISWLCLWIGTIFVIFHPDYTTVIAEYFGIGRGADFIIYLSVITLFYILFRIFVKLDKIQKDISFIVQRVAFLEAKKNKLK